MIATELLDRLSEADSAPLIEQVSRTLDQRPLAASDVARWRRTADPPLVAAAIDLATARLSLRGRIAAADALWCDRAGAAQASDDLSAQWKAQRVSEAASELRGADCEPKRGAPWLVDYCCGAGADLAHLALALDGRAEGVDMRADRAWMARRNAGVAVHVADVRTWRSEALLAHIDPSRRDEDTGVRRHGWDALEPGPDVLADLIAHHAGVMIKLGPGTDVPPDARPAGSELVVLSRHGTLTQALLCTGSLAHPPVERMNAMDSARAVLLRAGMPSMEIAGQPTWSSGRGAPDWPCASAWKRIIAEPDPALERSGMLPVAARALGLAEVHPGLGLCTDAGAECDLTAIDASPWWRTWDVVELAPGRLDDVCNRVRALGAGTVDVKVRGGAADADEWARQLRGNGTAAVTVFVHRVAGRGIEGVIARQRCHR